VLLLNECLFLLFISLSTHPETLAEEEEEEEEEENIKTH
jgi:hypothetical protein